jgi:protein-S-isoprenylcysteine O-methyltransferase Ste14
MTSSTSATPDQAPGKIRISFILKGMIVSLVFLVIYLIAAGRWDWWPAWIYTGILNAYNVGSALASDPALLVERTGRHANTKKWDPLYVGLAAALLPLLAGIVAGLDERFGWGPEVSQMAQIIAGIVCVIGYGIVGWAMWANAYFSAVVRIQTDRGHQVATGGPYRIVRHPGYVGAMLFTLAMPVLMGSVWGLIPAVIAAVLYAMRTRLEDRTLQEELPGYAAFAGQTRYRLLPGVW